MSTNVAQNSAPAKNIMQVIQSTPVLQIADLDFVREKFIQNYNSCNKEKIGEIIYHRNIIHVKQALMSNKKLSECDPFSIYACIVTAAANGYSLDPQDNEVYLIARDGKMRLDRQAGSHVKRLIRTGQIDYMKPAKLVYQGDVYEVENGRVIRHIEKYQSDNIIAGYAIAVLTDGNELHFTYRRSDWEAWRKKSPNPRTYKRNGQHGEYLSESLWDNGVIDGTNPEPGFLRTKIVKHACNEKCWAGGNNLQRVETYSEVEIETEEDGKGGQQLVATATEHVVKQPAQISNSVKDDDFTDATVQKPVVVEHTDDNF